MFGEFGGVVWSCLVVEAAVARRQGLSLPVAVQWFSRAPVGQFRRFGDPSVSLAVPWRAMIFLSRFLFFSPPNCPRTLFGFISLFAAFALVAHRLFSLRCRGFVAPCNMYPSVCSGDCGTGRYFFLLHLPGAYLSLCERDLVGDEW